MLRRVYEFILTGSAPLGQGPSSLESLPQEVLQTNGIDGCSTL
jgi:hypothetical protein